MMKLVFGHKIKGFNKISDLDGKTIGVVQGSTTKAAIQEYGKAHHDFQLCSIRFLSELAVSLYANRISAFSVDKSILTGYVSKKQQSSMKVSTLKSTELPLKIKSRSH